MTTIRFPIGCYSDFKSFVGAINSTETLFEKGWKYLFVSLEKWLKNEKFKKCLGVIVIHS